ncbi:MAG: pyridoxamine 5'-phosphate oxidase family protein [Candidatus Omnitrophota bacterium]
MPTPIPIPEATVLFLLRQGFVIVSTIDENGTPHASCKGIVEIDKNGHVYLLDLYKARTSQNLRQNPNISLTAVDEHKFRGCCLKGKATIAENKKLKSSVKKAWDERITSRITQRILRNIKGEKGHKAHPEIFLPEPEYLIDVEVYEIVDLTPHRLSTAVAQA